MAQKHGLSCLVVRPAKARFHNGFSPREGIHGRRGELDLRSLNDDELVQQMHDDLYDGLKEEIEEGVNILLGRGTGRPTTC